MAYAVVQSKGTGFGTSGSIVWTSNTTNGNLIVVAVVSDQGAGDITGVSDSQGNTYTKIYEVTESPPSRSSVNLTLWYAKNITGGTTPTVTVTGTFGGNKAFIAREYSGLDTVSPLQQQITSTGEVTNSPDSTNAPNTAVVPALVFGVAGTNKATTYTAGSGFGNLLAQGEANTKNVAIEDKRVTSGGAYNAAFTVTNTPDWAAGVATFAESGATSTSTSSSTSISTSSTSQSTSTSSTSSSTSQSTSSSTSSTSTSQSTSTSSTSQSTSTSFSTSSTSSSISTSSTSTSVSVTTSTSSTSSSTSTSTSISTSTSSTSTSTSNSTSTSLSTSSTSSSTSSTSSSISTSTTIAFDVGTKPWIF